MIVYIFKMKPVLASFSHGSGSIHFKDNEVLTFLTIGSVTVQVRCVRWDTLLVEAYDTQIRGVKRVIEKINFVQVRFRLDMIK